MLPLVGGVYLGWALGSNDAANVFGTAVAARIIRFRTAAVLCSVAVVAGAAVQGDAGIRTLSGLTQQSLPTLIVVSVSAALTVTLMTALRLPISTSQAVVGAIAGVGLANHDMAWSGLTKVVVCWFATPVGALVVSWILFHVVGAVLRWIPMSLLTRDKLLWGGLIVVGVYGSYALGANNVANATGIFSGQIEGVSDKQLALIGGLAIAAGVLTYSKRVIMAVGSGLMRLDAFTAFVAVSSMAVCVHVFAVIGVPVSTSQAIVGAIVGIGMLNGVETLRLAVLARMACGWALTPAIALILSAAGYAIFA